jgi:hypothetical protein
LIFLWRLVSLVLQEKDKCSFHKEHINKIYTKFSVSWHQNETFSSSLTWENSLSKTRHLFCRTRYYGQSVTCSAVYNCCNTTNCNTCPSGGCLTIPNLLSTSNSTSNSTANSAGGSNHDVSTIFSTIILLIFGVVFARLTTNDKWRMIFTLILFSNFFSTLILHFFQINYADVYLFFIISRLVLLATRNRWAHRIKELDETKQRDWWTTWSYISHNKNSKGIAKTKSSKNVEYL